MIYLSSLKKLMTSNGRGILIILLLLFANHGISQVVLPEFNLVRSTKNFTIGKVVSMAQDRYGYMWFADQTNNCLVRYDGYHMKVYRNDPGDTNSINTKTFECIAADLSGNIWIPVPGGLDKFDFATNKFIHYRLPAGEDNFGSCMLIDRTGIIWGGGNGLESFDPATGKFKHYVNSANDNSSLSSNIVRSIYEDKAGVLWVGTGMEWDRSSKEGGLNKFNKETGTFTRYIHDSKNPNSLIGNKVRAIFEDSKGDFWVGTDSNGLHLMNRSTGTFERFTYNPLKPEKFSIPPVKNGDDYYHITFITEDVSGKLWVGTYSDGLICYDPVTKKMNRFTTDDKKRPNGYTTNSTWAAYRSKDGVLWISNEYSELFRIDPFQTGFTEVKMDVKVSHFLEDSSGNLWMTTDGKGLIIENTKTGDKKVYLHNPAHPFSISSNDGNFLRQRSDGQVWVSTWNGTNLFNPQTGKFKRNFYNATITSTNNNRAALVIDVLETKNETYFGLFQKLAVKNNNTGAMTYYVNNPGDTNSISQGIPVNFLDKGDGNIWMSVWHHESGALDLFNINTKKFKHYLKGLIVADIFKSSDQKMWVGTSKGLFFRNDSLDSFIQVGPEGSEFRKARLKSMTEDADKNIWGVSTLGIFRFNPDKNELNIYADKFGTFDVGISPYSPSYTSLSGELYFGNPHGYYKCFPKNVFNSVSPQIVITDFKIDGNSIKDYKKGILKEPLEEAKEITLRHDQNKISIDFAAIHFAEPENNIHQYLLEGYEKEWRDLREEKTAYYFNVPPGHYIFRVRATSSYGVSSEKSVKIIVLPPWWQTWWAYTLYALLLAFSVWRFVKWRTKALQKEKIKLEEKITERTKELKEEKELVESTLSELKSTQSQLIQSEKMASLGELTAGIAHEIQNPLNFVNNFSEVSNELIDEMNIELEKGDINEAKAIAADVKQNLEKINHHGKRADAIVKGMLQHSRSSSGVKEPTDINALCDEYLRLAYHGLRAKDKSFNATMKTDFDDTIGKINIIPQDIGRVVLNLINNAFYVVDEKKKLNPENYEPTVTVKTLKNPPSGGRGAEVLISVSDNGNGIPPKVLDKIFQPFFTTKPTGQGTGLGLSLSYDIIKAHGGEIKVETKEARPDDPVGRGEGTEFIIQLPIT